METVRSKPTEVNWYKKTDVRKPMLELEAEVVQLVVEELISG